ncbi:MAG: hypothetical protein C0407_01420 [Desulfobacca sp.]|nr:hypothetical protein [Desulfobacca sp.]
MNPYPFYQDLNRMILAGQTVRYSQWKGPGAERLDQMDADRPLTYPRIGIYSGMGCSHSWLWFVDLFERFGFLDLVFLEEDQVKAGQLRTLDCLALSGGDTIAMAEGLGRDGANQLGQFLEMGGLYLGSCAGAYLPLNSSKDHLDAFNFVEAKISNLTNTIPENVQLPEKCLTPYGCSYVFHPVREAVELTSADEPALSGKGRFQAPLYGGPGLIPGRESRVLARYSGFTAKTLFLVDPDLARKTLLDKAAILRNPFGRGSLVLFGPHVEHSYFPVANKLLTDIMFWELSRTDRSKRTREHNSFLTVKTGSKFREWIREVKREISNSRIVANGLETKSIQWRIGNKIYEPIKIRFFLEALWSRLGPLEKGMNLILLGEEEQNLPDAARQLTFLLRELKNKIDDQEDTLPIAKELFQDLQGLTRNFLTIYFRSRWSGLALNRN